MLGELCVRIEDVIIIVAGIGILVGVYWRGENTAL